jgi:hypothetical protein
MRKHKKYKKKNHMTPLIASNSSPKDTNDGEVNEIPKSKRMTTIMISEIKQAQIYA